MLAVIYLPWLQSMFKTGSLDTVGWAFVLAGAAIFVTFREVDRLVQQLPLRAKLDAV